MYVQNTDNSCTCTCTRLGVFYIKKFNYLFECKLFLYSTQLQHML